MQYTVLVSHELYGSCYIDRKGELIKGMEMAITFPDYETASKETLKACRKFDCPCYTTPVHK